MDSKFGSNTLPYALGAGLFTVMLMKWMKSKNSKDDLNAIPGPTRSFWDIAKTSQKKDFRSRTHLMAQELHKKYGGVVRIKLSEFRVTVIVSDFDLLYKMLVKEGKPFGGRSSTYVFKTVLNDSGILFSTDADKTWRTLRQTSQKHLRQFGEGLTRLERIITEVAEDMFDGIMNQVGKPFDPKNTIFDTALNSIAFLITGERTHTGDDIIEKMREYEGLLLGTSIRLAPTYFNLLNVFPWLRYLGFSRWDRYMRLAELHDEIWKTVKDMNENNPAAESIFKVLMSHIQEGSAMNERDAQAASLSLLFAGVITTSTTFYAMINIFAHNKIVQDKVLSEIRAVQQNSDDKTVNLQNRNEMPYSRAVLLETLRLTSVVALGVPHKTVTDTKLDKYNIPAGTEILTDLWTLHHDEEFWEKPFEFYPERYLDESGDLVPADHPFRTHLMPFGAGTRVCLGESLAMARLFIWMTTLVDRFEVNPAPGNEKSSIDPRSFWYEGVLRPHNYQVVFEPRG